MEKLNYELLEWNWTYDIIIILYAYDEVERCIASIDNFVLPVLEKAALVFCPAQALSDEFAFQSHSLTHTKTIEVLS